MPDTTVSSETSGRESRAIVIRNFSSQAARHAQDDDESLARVLITSWTLLTGRTLPVNIPPELVSAEELVSFWADAQMTAGVTRPSAAANAGIR